MAKAKYFRFISLKVVREQRAGYVTAVQTPEDAVSAVRGLIGDADREVMMALMLDTKHRIAGAHIISVGTLNASPVHPREVFKAAVAMNAAAIILAHNHPSGDPTPSRQDREVTQRIKDAGEILGIELLDHIIIGDGRWTSLKQGGAL